MLPGSWKDRANNNLDNIKNWVADTIVAFYTDNNIANGGSNLMADWKAARAKYGSVIDTNDPVIPACSTDKKEHRGLVWAISIDAKLNGTKDTVAIMETWQINKDGKAGFLSIKLKLFIYTRSTFGW